jgi:hypothetical protein
MKQQETKKRGEEEKRSRNWKTIKEGEGEKQNDSRNVRK